MKQNTINSPFDYKENITMNKTIVKEMIQQLKEDGVTLNHIQNELDYRENSSSDMKWDDNLYEYTTDELLSMEQTWHEVR